eukprot:TRINITY_DN8185_c2_g1_i3.p1 TRINITY_DN8185_c2_g1~~TRINITY_DN8185_c2_g1_i3.p1  ORF type:complete len:255 (+),score=50.91 TRINITY_DN8185_c2_g1_i3:161-925(+)
MEMAENPGSGAFLSSATYPPSSSNSTTATTHATESQPTPTYQYTQFDQHSIPATHSNFPPASTYVQNNINNNNNNNNVNTAHSQPSAPFYASSVPTLAAEDDDRLLQMLSQMSPSQVLDQIRHLEEWAFSLGMSERKELQRGKVLNILGLAPSPPRPLATSSSSSTPSLSSSSSSTTTTTPTTLSQEITPPDSSHHQVPPTPSTTASNHYAPSNSHIVSSSYAPDGGYPFSSIPTNSNHDSYVSDNHMDTSTNM